MPKYISNYDCNYVLTMIKTSRDKNEKPLLVSVDWNAIYFISIFTEDRSGYWIQKKIKRDAPTLGTGLDVIIIKLNNLLQIFQFIPVFDRFYSLFIRVYE